MNARERILRDNGLLTLAAAVALTASGSALAAKPAVHHPTVRTHHVHADPHNFVRPNPLAT